MACLILGVAALLAILTVAVELLVDALDSLSIAATITCVLVCGRKS